jgi:hypothetical protein
LRLEIRCMSGQFVDDDGRRRSAQRLSTAAWMQCVIAGSLIPPLAGMPDEVFAARREQRSLPARSAVAVIAAWTPIRRRLSDFAAALMAATPAADCAEGRVDAGFGGLRATTQHEDRRWWGRTW